MNSNDIAWGIIKAVLILAGLYYIGSFLLGLLGVTAVIAIAYIGDAWKLVLTFFVVGIIWALFIQPLIKMYFTAHIEPRLNQSHKGWRWASLFAFLYCFIMFVIPGLAFINMTRSVTSTDIGILAFAVIGMPIFLYLALRRSNVISAEDSSSKVSQSAHEIPNIHSWEQTERTNQLYCYQCAKKLGEKTWDNSGRSYCDACHKKLVEE